MTTLVSPMSTRPTRWWIATRHSSCRSSELRGQIGHDLLGHALVGLVLEMDDVTPARARPRRSDERRDRAGRVVSYLGDGGVDRQGIGREPEVAAGDRRDDRDLVPGLERLGSLDVCPITRVEEPGGLGAEVERGPDVTDRRAVRELELDGARSGPLADCGEQPDVHVHVSNGIRRLPPGL